MRMNASPKLINGLENCASGERIVTIGTFDGVHRGHRALIEKAIARAEQLELRVTALTFEPVPASVLRPDKFAGRVCSAAEKLALLSEHDLAEIVTVRFDANLAEQSAEAFMASVVQATGLRELWVGEGFALGRNRAGNIQRLVEIGESQGFSVTAVQRTSDGDQIISSSGIRQSVMDGNVAAARQALGRPFRISGEVILGAQLGRTIGYPTANVVPPAELVPLADGIYASLTTLPGDSLPRPAMTYVGTRPTVNSGDRLIETHLLDFDGDLYGQVIAVDVLERLRGDAVFAGVDALIEQLRADEAATRAFLAGIEEN